MPCCGDNLPDEEIDITGTPHHRLLRSQEYRRRMPVDKDFRDIHPVLGVPAGAQARAHLGILEPVRGDFELQRYERSPWMTLNKGWRENLMRVGSPPSTSVSCSGPIFSWTDRLGTARDVKPSVSGNCFTSTTYNATPAHSIGYGDGSTAPTSSDYGMESQIGAYIGGVTVVYDSAALSAAISSSRIHTEVDGTIRELGLFTQYRYGATDGSSALGYFMVDRAAVAATSVLSGQAVAVAYEVLY